MRKALLYGIIALFLLSGCLQKQAPTGGAVGVEGEQLAPGTICNALGAYCVDSCNSLLIPGADCAKPLVCCKE